MYSKIKSMGHPLHLMLVNFPIGLLTTSVIFDILHWVKGNGFWSEIAFWMITVGIISGLLAALVGTIDWTGIPSGTHARRVGVWHGTANGAVLALFLVSWLLRLNAPGNPFVVAYIVSFLGAALLGVTGWLGGELTGRFGVGIEEGANINAPMTFSGLPANAASPVGHSSPKDKTPVVE